MNQNEAIDILETINELYSRNFDLTEKKVAVLLPQLLKMDYHGVTRKLSDYAAKNPFPPTLADIAVYPPEKNEHLEKIKQWEEEAKQVPEATKKRFREQLNQLIEAKRHD